MEYVTLTFGDRTLRLKENALTVYNISMIFRLERDSLFIHSEEGEIVLPEDGKFNIAGSQKKYIVSGNPVAASGSSPNPSTHMQLGIPISYQNERSRLNPPPCSLKRPQFTIQGSSALKSKQSKTVSWKKAVIVVDIDGNGTVTEKFQLHLALEEGTATVGNIKEQLKDQLGYAVELLDCKHLPILENDMTKGSQFWRTARKVIVAPKHHVIRLKKQKKGRWDILEQLRKMIAEPSLEAESDTETHSVTQPAAPSVKQALQEIFRCSICFSTAQLPAASCSKCFALIGCIPCIEQWIEISPTLARCPLCRTNQNYAIIPLVRGLATALGQAIPESENNHSNYAESDHDTIPYMDDEDDNDDDSSAPLTQMI